MHGRTKRSAIPRLKWNTKDIDAIRILVDSEIATLRARQSENQCRESLKQEIYRLAQFDDTSSLQRLLLTIFHVLDFHGKSGGLSEGEVSRLLELAQGILQKSKITPFKSKLAYLYGDLHRLKSQIYLREGKVWASTWQQQMALQVSGAKLSQATASQLLTLAARCMRMGQCALACEYYAQAEQSLVQSDPSAFEMARLGQLRCLRLKGALPEFDDLMDKTLSLVPLSPSLVNELHWEKCRRDIFVHQDLNKMMELTRKGKSHYQAPFLLEAFFWTRAIGSNRWHQEFSSITAVFRRTQLDARKDAKSFRLAMSLEHCSDTEIPFLLRLGHIEKVIVDIEGLESIDQQLLCWLAICRWLNRSKSFHLARLVLAEYTALSLRISDGRSRDSLGIADDLIQKSWLRSDEMDKDGGGDEEEEEQTPGDAEAG